MRKDNNVELDDCAGGCGCETKSLWCSDCGCDARLHWRLYEVWAQTKDPEVEHLFRLLAVGSDDEKRQECAAFHARHPGFLAKPEALLQGSDEVLSLVAD